MTLWHIPLIADPDDGYVACADTADEALALVLAERDRGWREELAKYRREWPDRDDAWIRRWYFWGVHLTAESPDPDAQLGTPVEVGPVFSIPFLGYSW